MNCRHCASILNVSFAHLGSAPPSNAYLTSRNAVEKWYPLSVLICTHCWLVQTEDYTDREEIFSPEYAYFSSYSSSWLSHSKRYVEQMIQRFSLSKTSMVGEIAANDGYLLQYFQERQIPCFGVEPTQSTAQVAREKGLTLFEEFFGASYAAELVKQGWSADLLIANNVLAHVPDLNDFVSGFRLLLKPQGIVTFEFPHLYRLVTESQFDTIYHEHFSYLSFITVQKILQKNGLEIFDVEELSTHGGSLRVFAQRKDMGLQAIKKTVADLLQLEEKANMNSLVFYQFFQKKMLEIKCQFLTFLLERKAKNEAVWAYGAAAKGNTLLNFSGVRSDLLSHVIDRNPAKQNKYLPGSRIPIVSEDRLKVEKPKWIVILPWNLKDEIINQLSYARDWGAVFVTAIPTLRYF